MINRKGMTLVELLVYMVLAALVLAPVIMLMNNSSVNMARDAGRANLHMSGREILQVIYDDLKNTGFKLGSDPSGGFSEDRAASNFDDGDRLFSRGSGKCCKAMDSVKCSATCESGGGPIAIKDSASFYNNSCYIFTSPTEYLYNSSGEDSKSFSGTVGSTSTPSYTGNFKDKIRLYDTIGVRMVKLGEDANGLYSKGVFKISYKVQDINELMLIRTVVNGGDISRTVLARNVAALKFRFSDNLKDWYDYFTNTDSSHVLKRRYIQYVKVILVLKDPKKLSATNNAQPITLIENGDGKSSYYKGSSPEVVLRPGPGDQALYEKYEIVVPLPNNGLYLTQ
jgi:hypothetical protein